MKSVFFTLSLLFITSAKANSYYFSTSSGDDLRSVLQAQNPATPWKTISKLNSFFKNIKPGDSVLFCRGDIFKGSIAVNISGTNLSPITITSYGTGALPLITLPEITGWTKNVNGTYSVKRQMWPTISIFYQDGKPLLKRASSAACIDGSWWCDNANLFYKPTSGSLNDHSITVANPVAIGGYEPGIDLSNSSYITVENLELNAFGIGVKTFDTFKGTIGLTIQNSTFSYCQSAILFMPDIGNNINAIVSNCLFYRNQCAVRMYTTSSEGGRPGQTHGTNIGCKIIDNEMSGNGTIDGIQLWTKGTDFEAIGVQNFMGGTIANNYVHDGFQIGIILYNLKTRSSDNNTISGNRIMNNKKGGLVLQGDDADEGSPANYSFNNNFIANNVFINSAYTSNSEDGTVTIMQGSKTTKTNYFVNNTLSGNSNNIYFATSRSPFFTIENNIIYNSAGYQFVAWNWSARPTTLVMDYNLYFKTSSGNYNFIFKNNKSLANMQSIGLEMHSQIANPEVMNASANDYHLTPPSPAIDAGVNVGLPFSGSLPDIGAYEYVNPVKLSQSINFASIGIKIFGDAPFAIIANASSGLPVSFKVISGGASILGGLITLSGEGTVTIQASQAGNNNYDAAQALEQNFIVLPAVTSSPCSASGSILREQWNNITGTDISAIPLQQTPSGSSQLILLETQNTGSSMGARIRGYICAPISGNYTFFIAGDDDTELWLSNDGKPANKVKIAGHSGGTGFRKWNKYPSQKSALINLKAGNSYYIEVLHKNNIGRDDVSVKWVLPNGTSEAPIPGKRLSPYASANVQNRVSSNASIENKVVAYQAGRAFRDAEVISVYPNPFQTTTTITVYPLESGDATMELYDIRGRRVKSITKISVRFGVLKTFTINSDNLASGVYIIRLVTKTKVISKKITISR